MSDCLGPGFLGQISRILGLFNMANLNTGVWVHLNLWMSIMVSTLDSEFMDEHICFPPMNSSSVIACDWG